MTAWRHKNQQLRDALDRADRAYISVSKEFMAILRDVPSGIPHPDGAQRFTQIVEKQRRALDEYKTALRALHDHALERPEP